MNRKRKQSVKKKKNRGQEGEAGNEGGRKGEREERREGRGRRAHLVTRSVPVRVCSWLVACVRGRVAPVRIRSHLCVPVCARSRLSAVVSYPSAPVGVCSCVFVLSRGTCGRPGVLVHVRAL